jgi:glycerol uptake facilitator-like aquaporin
MGVIIFFLMVNTNNKDDDISIYPQIPMICPFAPYNATNV